jgi:hypothetical protein
MFTPNDRVLEKKNKLSLILGTIIPMCFLINNHYVIVTESLTLYTPLYNITWNKAVPMNVNYISRALVWFKQDSQCTYNVTMRRARESLLPWKRNKYYLLVGVCMYSRACVRVAGRVGVCMRIRACCLANPHAMRMRHIVTSFVAPQCGPNISTYLINGAIFVKKIIERKMCFDFLYNLCLKHFPF